MINTAFLIYIRKLEKTIRRKRIKLMQKRRTKRRQNKNKIKLKTKTKPKKKTDWKIDYKVEIFPSCHGVGF